MKRLAIVTTVYRYLSHAQHIGDRFLVGYPRAGKWHKPDMKVVALYVDQKPDGDLSSARGKEFGFSVYPSIAEALRCGSSKIAVDAVLSIVEHGNYPRNEKGQVLYPRHEFFKQYVDVFEKDGVSVPVYNDKHLSYSFEKAQWMVAASERLKFPMLAGSSLPGAVKDFNFAARVKGQGVQSTQFFLSPEPNVTYSACLVSKIEEMFASGKAPYPVERTLLVSGILESCLTSKIDGHRRLETPHLDVKYRAPKESQHSRA